MNRFRIWSKRAWLLHGYLLAVLFLPPFPMTRAYWADTDGDGQQDAWIYQDSTTQSLAQLDAQNLDFDGDGAYNDEELAYGSDPFDYDTDNDGLNDGDEIHIAIQQYGKVYSLTNWDSNGDCVSDFDDFYGYYSVTYPGGQLPSFDGATYSDYDADGIKNPFDPYPADPNNNDADRDGIDDSVDPAPSDANNYSSYNASSWGSSALDDADSDAILNFWDQWPYDSSNGSSDADGDGIDNSMDPFPTDFGNYSSLNGITWYGNVFGDDDMDGMQNYADQWPYDQTNGNPPPADGGSGGDPNQNPNDFDNDGISNDLDPLPNDSSNYSPYNSNAWYGQAVEDADNDGTSNFYDSYPSDPYNGVVDYDGDGWLNENDPFPRDNSNFSDVNQTAWYGAMCEDADSDGALNWQDAYPNDRYNGNPDVDGDYIPNDQDPYPTDNSNYSETNQIAWGGNVLGDDDNDSILNWQDPTPYPEISTLNDSDNDGFVDSYDPVPSDSSNPSPYNGQSWYGNINGDNDNDGVLNFWDQWPDDQNNGAPVNNDVDNDGIPDSTDPNPGDSANYSSANLTQWYGNALGDDDGDGVTNFYDPTPEGDNTNVNNNVDGDSYDDSIDPATNDPSNFSSANNTAWYGDALNDADGDMTPNFWDAYPYDSSNGGNTGYDYDYDGLANDVDPMPYDGTNYSPNNWTSWYGNALGDVDNDGILNFYDYNPYTDDNADSDYDGLVDVIDPAPSDPYNYSSVNGLNWLTGALDDADSDGVQNFFDPTPDTAFCPPPDEDQDGLNLVEENSYGTSDQNVDSDGDGISDGAEVHTWGSDPANAYSLSERMNWGDIYKDAELIDSTDSDVDGIPDAIERHYGLNPSWPKDALLDRDNNGINNITQYNMGRALDADLSDYDKDGDGMTDVFEDAWQLQKNSDEDGVLDADNDGVLNYEEYCLLTSPRNVDTLQQGGLGDLQVLMLSVHYPDGSSPSMEDTAPSNGIPDWAEALRSTPAAPDYAHFARESAADLDGDGMSDYWEHEYGAWKYSSGGLDPRDARDAILDPDHDGLTNLTEFRFGSNPLVPDSNHDSISDSRRLYNTGVVPRSLNAVTNAYRPQATADYIETRDDVPKSFTEYGDSGDPGDPEPNEWISVWQDFHVTSTIFDDYFIAPIEYAEEIDSATFARDEFPVVSAYSPSGPVSSPEDVVDPVGPERWIDSTGLVNYLMNKVLDNEKAFYGLDPLNWKTRVKLWVGLSEPYPNDHTFKFEVTYSDGSPTKEVEITIPAGEIYPALDDPNQGMVEAEAPPGGWAKIKLIEDHDDPQIVNFSVSDGAGSRYRKVSLTGIPLADAKPQVQDESGEREEETHIDAFNRHLQHGVTDIYASDPTTQLPLSVRRDVAPEAWCRSSGLRPDERPDLPFGPCWTSNICSFVRFTDTTNSQVRVAEVHDEQGSVQKFLSDKNGGGWQHSREELGNARTLSNTFNGQVLHKKFGTTCTYEPANLSQSMPTDRLKGSTDMVTYNYARLHEVRDRLGNRLLYEYPNLSSLIPNRVYDPDRPGRQIYVMHQNGRVTSVRGPAGEEVVYENSTLGLSKVTRGDTQVKYTYLGSIEIQDDASSPCYHIELASITDERDNTYRFEYQFDHTTRCLSFSTDGSASQRVRTGLPMQLTEVSLPDGSFVHLNGGQGSSRISVPGGMNVTAPLGASTFISGPAGVFNYVFSQPVTYMPMLLGQGPDEDLLSINITVTFTRLCIISAAGLESYEFNPDAMFALSSATDLSGNTHSFGYGPDGFDDPVTETDAMGNTKHFTYDSDTRVMSSITDQTGVVTSYEIQPLTGLKLSETVRDAGGAVKRSSVFEYNHPTYKGFMTQSTVDASSEDTAPATVAIYSLGTGDYGWATITETIPTSVGNAVTTTVHDLSGNKRSVIDGRGLVTNFDYDEHLRLTQVTYPDGTHKNLIYDAHGNLTREVNENGCSSFHEYDNFNRRTKTTLDLNGNGESNDSYGTSLPNTDGVDVVYNGDIVTTKTYNARNQVLTQVDARGKLISHTYDAAGRLTATDDGGLVTSMEYGANSGGSVFENSGFKPTQITDPSGTVTVLDYDKMYRIKSKTVSYHSIAPGSFALKSAAEIADQTYRQARTQTLQAAMVLQTATSTLHHLDMRCDISAAWAAVDDATAALQTANAVLSAKTNARQVAEQEMQTAAEEDLESKTALFHAALSDELTALKEVEKARVELDEANQDSAIAFDGAVDADTLAALQDQRSDAQEAFDAATTDLAARQATEATEQALKDAAYQDWNALGDNTVYTATTSTEYDAAGRPTQVTDALGRVTHTIYDVFGQIQQVTHPDGTSVSTAYTHHGKPWMVTDELGHQTTTTFDEAGRAVQVSGPALDDSSRPTTITEYDAASNPIRITDPLGRVTESEYDERNRVVAVYAPPVWDGTSGHFVRPFTQTSYDALGQVLTVTDPLGNVTTHLYDNAGRNWKVIAPAVDGASPTTVTLFDPGGLAMQVTNPLGQTVTNTYDIHGRLITTLDAAGITNTFAYDEVGNRTSVKDGKNQETTFGYDGLNRLIWQTFANGDTWTYAYDAVRKLSQTSSRGIITSYTYDDRDRVLTTTAPGISRTYGYDPAGHLLSVTEAGNPAATVVYTYDALSRVTSETSLGITHSYGYDLAGNRTSATYGTGRYVQTSYDSHNRPELISEGGRVTRYGYDLAGRAVALVAGNGQTSSNTYDALGRLMDRTLFRTTGMSESEVLAEFSWTHDALGNVTQQLETWPGDATRAAGLRSTAMTYDANNRLSTETITEPSGAITATTYVYDDANNRTSKTVTGGTDPGVWSYSYNAANQLTEWTQISADSTLLKSASLTYDADGNRTSQTITGTAGIGINPPPAAAGTTSYAWDSQGRLISITLPDGATEYAYDYDYRTRRIGTHKYASGVEQTQTAIVFAGGLSLAEYESASSSMSATPSVEYTRGPDMGGGVGGMLYSLRSGAVKYSLSNGRGDIVAQSDSSASLTWTASYEAYGRRTQETGSNEDKQRGNSKDEDPTGLLNEGFRYRDLETGVWLSRDPAGFVDGPNLYAYVVQNPWSKFDPHGLSWREWVSTTLDFVPGVSTVKSVVELVAGQDLITGEAVSRAESAASLGASFIPGGKGALKVAKTACKIADKVFEVQGKADAVMAVAGDIKEGNVGFGTLMDASSLRGGGKKRNPSDIKGGAHRDTTKPPGDGLESHHMPADSINGIPKNDGPAIKMDPADHEATSSWGGGREAEAYREKIKKKIDAGNMRGAMAEEIRDVRRAAQEVSGDRTKYNSGMREMMDYAREKNMIPKNPQTKVERTR